MVALAVLATGPLLTNAYLAIDEVDRDVVEAARGMGMSGAQLLRRVELPLGLPLLFTGIRIAAVTVVATAPIAAVAGGGGLGDVIVNQASYRLSGVLGAAICVMALSAGVWIGLLALQEAITPTGIRVGRVPTAGKKRRRSSDQEAQESSCEGSIRHLARSRNRSRLVCRHCAAGDQIGAINRERLDVLRR